RSWNDLQRGDLVAFENEEIAKVQGAAREVSDEMAGDYCFPVLLRDRDRLAGIVVFGRCRRFPCRDGCTATISMAFVLHDSGFGEVAGDGVARYGCLPLPFS